MKLISCARTDPRTPPRLQFPPKLFLLRSSVLGSTLRSRPQCLQPPASERDPPGPSQPLNPFIQEKIEEIFSSIRSAILFYHSTDENIPRNIFVVTGGVDPIHPLLPQYFSHAG